MKAELGDLDRVKRIVKMLGMVNAMSEFGHQPEVINGCSDLFVEVFGDRGRHARSAVGMGSLPRGIPVEIEVIVEVEDEPARSRAAARPAAESRRRPPRRRRKRRSVEPSSPPAAAGGAAGGSAGRAGAFHLRRGLFARRSLHPSRAGAADPARPLRHQSRRVRRTLVEHPVAVPAGALRLHAAGRVPAAGHQSRRARGGGVVAAALARDLALAVVGAGGDGGARLRPQSLRPGPDRHGELAAGHPGDHRGAVADARAAGLAVLARRSSCCR